MSEIETIAATLLSVAVSGMKRKELLAAVRRKHPEASKKDIVRAAFYALTDSRNGSPEKARQLHAFALSERADEEEDGAEPKARKRPKRKVRETQQAAH